MIIFYQLVSRGGGRGGGLFEEEGIQGGGIGMRKKRKKDKKGEKKREKESKKEIQLSVKIAIIMQTSNYQRYHIFKEQNHNNIRNIKIINRLYNTMNIS